MDAVDESERHMAALVAVLPEQAGAADGGLMNRVRFHAEGLGKRRDRKRSGLERVTHALPQGRLDG
jgi:hypothetical protein